MLNKLSDAAQKILDDQPEAWEYLLFAQVLEDELALARQRAGLVEPAVAEAASSEDLADFAGWIGGKLEEFKALLHRLPLVVNQLKEDAFGPPGTAGNAETIHLLAQEVALVFREALQWRRHVEAPAVAAPFGPARDAVARIAADTVQPIEQYPALLRERITRLLREPPPPGTIVALPLELAAPDTEALTAALDALGRLYDAPTTDTTEVTAFEAWFQDEQLEKDR